MYPGRVTRLSHIAARLEAAQNPQTAATVTYPYIRAQCFELRVCRLFFLATSARTNCHPNLSAIFCLGRANKIRKNNLNFQQQNPKGKKRAILGFEFFGASSVHELAESEMDERGKKAHSRLCSRGFYLVTNSWIGPPTTKYRRPARALLSFSRSFIGNTRLEN